MRQFSFRDHPLLEGVAATRIDALLSAGATNESLARGALLFDPARDTPALVFILSGNALVYKASDDGHRVLMSRLRAGDVFGMASLFYPGDGFPTEIIAEKQCDILRWPRAAVEAAFAAEPRLSRNYITLLSERIHFLNRRIDDLHGDDVHSRLRRVLLDLAGDTAPGEAFTLPYSLSQLADLLGIGRASLYRALDGLEEAHLLRRDGKQFTLLSPTDSQ